MTTEFMPPGADIFASGAQALINPVDCTGAQGKGLALAFKKRFPGAAACYLDACRAGEIQPGRVFLVGNTDMDRSIVFFPSKRHWRQPSRVEDIRDGLRDMVRRFIEIDVRSVAIPALGCGLGELAWGDVRPLLVEAADAISEPGRRVMIYEPHEVLATRQR